MYADLTFRDPNPVKRFLQRRRLAHAIELTREMARPRRILDFGAGNGELCRLLRAEFPAASILCFEPDPGLMGEALHNLSAVEGVEFLSDLNGHQSVDLIFCLEVFEHLPEAETAAALRTMAAILADDGRLIIGLPVEVGVPALYKGVFRMVRRYGADDARPRRVFAAVLGLKLARPRCETAHGGAYHPFHIGFDHRSFE